MALKLASLLCTCIINVVSKRDVHGSRNMFVSEICCRALGRAGTGCWCDACKHLKKGLQKSRVFLSSDHWALQHWIFWFLTGRCPISGQHLHLKHSYLFVPCFYIASYCATSAQTLKPPSTLHPSPKCHWISAISLISFSFAQVLRDVQDWMKTHSFQIPRLTSLLRTRDHWGAPRTTAHLMFRITHNIPVVLDGSALRSHSLIQYSHLK